MGSNTPPINIFSLGLAMFVITTLPVCMGLYMNTKHHSIVNSFAPIANKISTLLFIIIVAGALGSEWKTFIDNLTVLGPSIIASK